MREEMTVHASYTVTVSDFRRASYFGLFLRHRRPLQILFVVTAGCILYAAGGLLGFGTVNPLVFFLGGAYLLWGLFLLAGAEKQVLRYIKSPDSCVGEPYEMQMDGQGNVVLTLSRRGEQTSFRLKELTCAFEMSQLFLLYTSASQTYLLPKRALTGEQQVWLRGALRQALGANFGSRFEKKG